MTTELTLPSTPSPSSLWLTHPHRSIGYHNIPQPLTESTTRLIYLRVYDSRDRSSNPGPSPSFLSYSLTHPHRSIGDHTDSSVPYDFHCLTQSSLLLVQRCWQVVPLVHNTSPISLKYDCQFDTTRINQSLTTHLGSWLLSIISVFILNIE